MAPNKMAKKKGSQPEGTPLENYETSEMNLKELKKYAVKLGVALNETRMDRFNLEIDRDKMLRNLVNVVSRRMIINREIRNIDRDMINKENIFERTMADKVNELAEIRFKQISQFYQSKNDRFVKSFEGKKEIFEKQNQMFVARTGLNSDYYKKCLELEGTFMAAKHESLCDKMDKVNERNIAQMFWTERRHYQVQVKLNEAKYEKYSHDMKEIVDKKEAIIENIQKEHVFECVDILKSFEDINKYNFVMIDELSKHLANQRSNARKIIRQSKELQRKCNDICSLIKDIKKDILTIKSVLVHFHNAKAACQMHSDILKTTEELTTNARLEVEFLADFIREDNEITAKLRQIVINDLLSLRQMQVKAHLFMMNLDNSVREMFSDRVRIGKVALCPMKLDIKRFQDLYDRYKCYRSSMIDIIERILRLNFSNLPALGFPQQKPASLPKLTMKSSDSVISDKPRRPPGIETGIPSVFKLPTHRRPRPQFQNLIMSLPRVPTRKSADHLLPYMHVQRVPIYIGNIKMPFEAN